MRYLAAYLLAVMGGNEHPDAAAMKKILSSVGVDFNEAQAKKVIENLKGKNTEDLIKKGQEKLASVPAASAVAAPAAAAPAAGAKAPEAKKEEKKKEEKKEESDDEDMGFGLFD